MLVGIPMAGIGFILLRFADSIIALNIVLGGLLGIGIKAGFLLPAQTATANWFVRKRSLALALVMTASVLGKAFITSPSEQAAGQPDWRIALVWLGVGILAIGVPLALVFKHRPEQYGKLPDGNTLVSDGETNSRTEATDSTIEVNFTVWQALKTRTFWLLTIASSLSAGIFSIVNIYRFIYLQQEAGFGRANVADIIQLIPVMGIAGILIFGYLGDRLPKRYLLAAAVLIQSASVLIMMAAGNTFHLYLYAVVFGLGSGTVPLLLAIRADYFGRKAFATITVVMTFLSGLIGILFSFLAPLAGWLLDISGSYELVFLLTMLLGLIPAAIFLLARPQKESSLSP